ncbi:MAG: hydroxyacid dehydrogenase [Lachnospiraceae bacterium]|nr:hydroxyacid dehydrogenase [Lachnospiraceae bacterium]
MKIAVLEAASLGKSVSLDILSRFGEVVIYQTTTEEEIAGRITDADILVINRLKMNERTLKTAKQLKYITLTATGVDCIDLDYTNSRGIKVANIKGYSTDSVAQHTVSLLLCLADKLSYYDSFVKSGAYSADTTGAYYNMNYHEIAGKKWGIVGLGNIGRRVAQIACALGAEVVSFSVSGQRAQEGFEQVDFETLITVCDIISIHTPLTEKSRNLFDYRVFRKMKETAILINTARGPIVNERDLARALNEGLIAAAGLDVLEKEPLPQDSPLLSIQDGTRLVVTPHVGWASVEARQRSVEEVAANIDAYLRGIDRNVVNSKTDIRRNGG